MTSAATALSATSQSPADGATPDVLATAVPLRDRAGRLSRFGASRTDRPAGLGTRVNVRRLHDRGTRPNLIERLAARRMPRSFLSSLDAARRTANESLLEDLLSIP